MPRLPLVPALLAAIALLVVPAEAGAECGGATGFHATEICPPVATFTVSPDDQVVPGTLLTFDASASYVALPRTIVKYQWSWDGPDNAFEIDGGTESKVVTHTLPQGKHTV